jgi:transcriptional regulator with XRE-family HTH domain
MIVLRKVMGDQLRQHRNAQKRSLRDISKSARVSLGYLSEVERGQKEPSSELLGAICGALNLPLSKLMFDVTKAVAHIENEPAGVTVLPVVKKSDSAAA